MDKSKVTRFLAHPVDLQIAYILTKGLNFNEPVASESKAQRN